MAEKGEVVMSSAKKKKLTAKQMKFVLEYMIDLNATQAAIRAGYSEKSAAVQGWENLRKPQIQKELTKRINRLSIKSEISAESVLKRLNEVADRCLQAVEVYDRDGNPTGEYFFDASGANRALELLGKHLRLFIERQEVTMTLTLAKNFVGDICDMITRHVEDTETVDRLIEELRVMAQQEVE